MEFKLLILSVACFSCLIPSAVSFNLLAAKVVAGQAAEDIAAIGVQTVAANKEAVVQAATDVASIASQAVALKGQAMKTAASSIAAALINGAVSIGATIARAGLNMVAAKFSAKPTIVYEPSIVLRPPVLQEALVEESVVQEPVVVEYDREIDLPFQRRPINPVTVDIRPPFIDLPAPPQLFPFWSTVKKDVEVVGPDNAVYEVVDTPQMRFPGGPLIDAFPFGK